MRNVFPVMLIAALAGCGDETKVTQPQQQPAQLTTAVAYQVSKLPSLGGALSRGMAINSQGWVAGWSNRADGFRRAVLWRDGAITQLGALGDLSSTVPWPGLNDAGTIVGISQTREPDPLDEDWSCELGGFLPETSDRICRGFVWENGTLRELPTLGGHHGFAAGINNAGQVVGWAETPLPDRTCTDAQVLQFVAVLWESRDGSDKDKTRRLRPLPSHSSSAATAISDDGLAVGISGDCDQAVGRFSARAAVLWDRNGKPTELPNLGGVTWHTPMDINTQGDVVGFSNPRGPGDPEGAFIARAFLWITGAAEAENLGTLDGNTLSQAFAVNAHRQVVGVSFGGTAPARAFLYEDGELKDLNDLVDTEDVLISAQDINDAGQITGRLRDAVTGQTLAFVATPIEETP